MSCSFLQFITTEPSKSRTPRNKGKGVKKSVQQSERGNNSRPISAHGQISEPGLSVDPESKLSDPADKPIVCSDGPAVTSVRNRGKGVKRSAQQIEKEHEPERSPEPGPSAEPVVPAAEPGPSAELESMHTDSSCKPRRRSARLSTKSLTEKNDQSKSENQVNFHVHVVQFFEGP